MCSIESGNDGTELNEVDSAALFENRESNKEDQKENKEEEDIKNNTSANKSFCARNFTRSNSRPASEHSFSRYKQRPSGDTRNEFRMARGGVFGDRGRSASGNVLRGRAFKKSVDTNSAANYAHSSSRSKFQESMKNHENKYYDEKKINEDSRVSKILRRLCRESDDHDHFLGLCKQLQDGIFAHENSRYIRRNLEIICDNLLDALHMAPNNEGKQQLSKCLGCLGYVADLDFKRFMNWLFNKYSLERKDEIKCLLINSFGETLKFDASDLKLKDFSTSIMTQLQSVLENVDKPELLRATVDAIIIVIEAYPECFVDHFRDTVDILVGWHIDTTQQKSVLLYSSRSLQKLHNFWIADLQFTLTLLSQFLEDMESYDDELLYPNPGRVSPGGLDDEITSPKECLIRISSLISVFNTVTKCISEHLNPNLTSNVQWTFLMDCLSKLLTTCVKAVELKPQFNQNEFQNGEKNRDTENLVKCMKNMEFSQKNIDLVLKHINQNDINEADLIRTVKSLNLNKDNNDEENALANSLNKEEYLVNLLKSMYLVSNNTSDLSEEKEELVITANESICLLLEKLQSRVTKSHELLYKFIELQLQFAHTFWDATVISMLNTISKVIKEVSANLPIGLVHTLLGKDTILTKLRFRKSLDVQNAALGVYYSLLSLKNIPLLQEAYRYILADFEIAYKTIVPKIEPFVVDNPLNDVRYKNRDAEMVLLFLLRSLSDIANASNSIIGMWALKPSILELLAVRMRPYDPILCTSTPLLQYHIIFLLYTHCSRYNNFIPSSNLISTQAPISCQLDIFPGELDVPAASPTSGHLSIILKLIAKCIENKKSPHQTLTLVLDWLKEIHTQSEKYISMLCKTKEYNQLLSSLVTCGASTNHKISLMVCSNLEFILKTQNATWSNEIYADLMDLITLHLTSFDEVVREKFGNLMLLIPFNILAIKINKEEILMHSKKFKGSHHYNSESIVLAQRLYMRHNNPEMLAQHFRSYMSYILQENNFDDVGLYEMITLCWPSISSSESMSKIYQVALANRSFLLFWAGFEAALYCGLNKLRTPLGKPQETFTTIEGSLKLLAREISLSDSKRTAKQELSKILNEHTRVRLLIEFLEHLERVIHNAADGCAVALLPLAKPVRTFFHTNRSTCKEWLNRIRAALCVVSLHAGLATSALRNGQRLIEDLSLVGNTKGVDFERAVLYTAKAMVMLGEAEALQGLYVYAKDKDRKFIWLKAAMEEAAGKYECATSIYYQVLEDYVKNSSQDNKHLQKVEGESHIVTFCMERISVCYHSTGDWIQLEKWKIREYEIFNAEENDISSKQMFGNIVPEQATCLRKFDNDELYTLDELSNWNLLDKESSTNWSNIKTMKECYNTITNIALAIYKKEELNNSFVNDLKQCKVITTRIIEEGLRNMPSEYLDEAILYQLCISGLEDIINSESKNVYNVFKISKVDDLDKFKLAFLSKILWWSDYFNKHSIGHVDEVDLLRLQVSKTARKELNFALSKREIEKYFLPIKLSFNDLVQDILNNGALDVNWTMSNIKAFREISKLLHEMGRVDDALRICSITALGISNTIANNKEDSSYEFKEIGSKVLLTLGKWIQKVDLQVDNNPELVELLELDSLRSNGLMDNLFNKTENLIPQSDIIVGKLIQLGTIQCLDLPSAWSSFAAWCYKWGRKIVDSSSSDGLLTEADRQSVRKLLPPEASESDFISIVAVLGLKNKVISEDEGDIDANELNTVENIENILRSHPVLENTGDEHLSLLVDVWRQAQARVYCYYEFAVNAYFTYLQLAKESSDCETITATLRLLRLVVKYASELQCALETGLLTTPTGPWIGIIPQLFSRLSHPESYVRARVSELLCRIAESTPHLITFPAVVGAYSVQKDTKITDIFHGAENGLSPNETNYFTNQVSSGEKEDKFVDFCFNQLTKCLSSKIPDSVDHVKILVKELRRITLLWDELWLTTLFQQHSEFSKRFEHLEMEVQKVQDNTWLSSEEKTRLIAEKYQIILKPIIFVLENLLSITSAPPETPHEKHFQQKYIPLIEKVIEKLKYPRCPSKPHFASQSLKLLETKIAQKIHKRGAYSLSMVDISPILANFKDTSIAMPGISRLDQIITIKSVEHNVQVLPTKTKPKKLMFRGSDGRIYTYLFKGLEDLHLDERIMQFLSICNIMMSKDNKNATKSIYKARHYSVIPLGPRSGLIQWVDGVTPLFALYKRWQQRETSMNNKTSSNSNILRPSELFYSKLTPLLEEKGITTENRKDWPLPILKKVLSELMAETPTDLLAKEIWCNSINAGNWWQATKSYSYSVAVMSIIGYIIGLGDRHLDNVLVDLNTGEVVHIDYNVCFEKGKTLRVPEKVPFRMTPNIKTALGVTGVEGIFRLACEHTLRVMRRGRETLLTLLEAFVYEPLIDWRAGADNGITNYSGYQTKTRHGAERHNLELELNAAMFAVRIAEMKPEWTANKKELCNIFPNMVHSLMQWIDAYNSSKQYQDFLQNRHSQLALVREAQIKGQSHSLFSLVQRYNSFIKSNDILDKMKMEIKEKIDECQMQINAHNIAVNTVSEEQLTSWLSELNHSSIQDDHLVFDLVKEFLQNAGQNAMIVQCEQSENELTQLAAQQSVLIKSCFDLLKQYSAIFSLYPLSNLRNHRFILYNNMANKLFNTPTIETCNELLTEFQIYLEPLNKNSTKVQKVVAFSYQLQTFLSKANDKFTKIYERMLNEGPDHLGKIKKVYSNSKAKIEAFLKRELGAEKALECVVVTALCVLNKKYLMMEGAAKCAGDCLVTLTSQSGDWFLDEMRLMSSLISELLSFIPENSNRKNDQQMSLIFKCLKNVDLIYKYLQELNFNFHTIIVPEASKTIITEEPSVMNMINNLDSFIASCDYSLHEILEHLEVHLRFKIMEIESPHSKIEDVVNNLRLSFESLLSGATSKSKNTSSHDENLTPGQMLLMGFNGLFEKLQMEGANLVFTLASLKLPASWRKIDQIRESRQASALIFKESCRFVLDDIFFVKRLITIQRFFGMCRSAACAFRSEDLPETFNYDDDCLSEPVKSFSADYVSRQLIGLGSQALAIALCLLIEYLGLDVTSEVEQRDIGAESRVSLEDLCKKAVDDAVKKMGLSSNVLAQASSLCTALESTWRRAQSAQLMQQALEISRGIAQRLQLQLTVHYWLNEDYLTLAPNMAVVNTLSRPAFMLELRKSAAALSALQSRVSEAQEEQQSLVSSAVQRLKWAAGANPALSEVISAFDEAVLCSNEKLLRQANLSSLVAAACSSIFHYEALRTRTQESSANDNNFIKLLKRWENCCLLIVGLNTAINPVEKSLVELLPVEEDMAADKNWLLKMEALVSEAIVQDKRKVQDSSNILTESMLSLKTHVVLLQNVIAEHHKLMSDVRMLLKNMSKQENIKGLQEFLRNYRLWTESLSAAVKGLEVESFELNAALELKEELEVLSLKTPLIYEELLTFTNQISSADDGCESSSQNDKLIRQDSLLYFGSKKNSSLQRDPTTGKAVQERNAYALNVWRRVRMKLEGRDPNPNRKYTTSEQVEYVIHESLSTENLALLYEGWTPWV